MTDSSKLIFMPLYWGDWLADTGHLSTEQHGCYFLLVGASWMRGPPEDDDESLAQIVRLPLERWKLLRPKLAPFFKIENGVWRHKRVEAELAKAKDLSGKRREAARAANEARRAKGHANAAQTDMQTVAQTEAQPHPHSHSHSESPLPLDLESPPQKAAAIAASPPALSDARALDPKQMIFGTCAAWLADRAERPVAGIRSQLGKWIRDRGGTGDGAAEVLAAIFACQRENPVGDPVAWIEGYFKTKANGHGKRIDDRGADTASNLRALAEQAEAMQQPN